jgi:flavorubredoxin
MVPNIVLIQCGGRSDGFSVSMGKLFCSRLDGELVHITYNCNPDHILRCIDESDIVIFASPIVSSELLPSFWDVLDSIHHSDKAAVLVVAAGNSGLFCRKSIKDAVKAILSLGFSSVVTIIVDNTYRCVKGKFSPKHLRRLDSALKKISNCSLTFSDVNSS